MPQHVKIEGLTNQASARTEDVCVSLTHFKSDVYNSHLVSRLKNASYTIPISLADHAACYMIGRDRDQSTWQSLLVAMRQYVYKNHGERNDKAQLTIYAAVYGFGEFAEEIASNNLIAQYKSEYKVLKESKTWVIKLPIRHKVLIGALFAGLVMIAYSFPILTYIFGAIFGIKSLHAVYGQDLYLLALYAAKCCRVLSGWCTSFKDVHDGSNIPVFGVKPEDFQQSGLQTRGVETPAVKETVQQYDSMVSKQIVVDKSLSLTEVVVDLPCVNSIKNFTISPVDVIAPHNYAVTIFKTETKSKDILNQLQTQIGRHILPNGTNSYIVDAPLIHGALTFKKIQCSKTYVNLKRVIDMHKPEKEPTPLFLIGPAWLNVLPAAFAYSSINEHASLCGRHLNYDHTTSRGRWVEALETSIHFFKAMVDDAPFYTLDMWIQDQPPIKRKRYSQYRDELNDMSFSTAKYHARNFFIKDEVLVPPYEGDLRKKFPRGIQGLSNPCTNMALGPFMHRVSEALSANFGGPLSYSSRRTPEQLGDWFQECKDDGFIFFEDDFSAFDSSQGAGAHWAEVEIYKLFGPDADVLYALQQQQHTVGYGHYFKYKTAFTRKSGDQNTSVGNTIINMVAHIWAINSYNLRGNSVKYRMLALGDDNLLAVKNHGPDFVTFINQQIQMLGLQPKFFQSTIAPTYCSSVFLPVREENGNERYVLVPEMLRRLTKIGWTITNVTGKETTQGRLKANEISQMNNSLMPVTRVFNQYYSSLQVASTRLSKWQAHDDYDSDYICSDNTREWFTSVYGVPWSSVLQLENFLYEHLNNCGDRPSFWSHDVASEMHQFYNCPLAPSSNGTHK